MNLRIPKPRPCLATACVLLFQTSLPVQGQQLNPPKLPGGQLGFPTGITPPPAGVQEAAQKALRLHKANKLTEAIAAYKEYLRRARAANLAASMSLPAYQNLATIYRGQGKVTELEDALKHCSALAPEDAAVHAELATIYATPKLGRFDEAAKEARKALTLKSPPQIASSAHAALGIVGVAKKDYATAEEEFAKANKLAPGNPQMMYNYGLALAERKKFAPALAAMQKVTALNPKMAGAWYYVGLLSESQQKYPESIKAFRQAVHLAPTDPTIHFDLARVLLRTNVIEDAITEYLVVLELAPQSVSARIAVAQLYVRLRNYGSGQIHYAEAAKLAPKNASVFAGLAECETELATRPQESAGRAAFAKQAEEHYRTAAALDAKYLVGYNSLARFYERTGSFAKAQDIYRKRMEANPADFANYNGLAQTYIMQRKSDEAIAVWRKFREQHPDNPNPYAQIAETLEAEGKWMDASAEWQLLLKQKLQSGVASSVMVAIGKDLARGGKNKEAVQQLEAVLKLDTSAPDAPKEVRVAAVATLQAERLEAMRQLAQLLENSSSFDEAIRYQQQVKAEEAAIAERSHSATNIKTYLDLARLYQRAKKPELAIKELDALTQTRQSRRENFAPVYEELAQIYESLNRFDDAAIAYRRSASFSKEPLNARVRAAEVYQRSSRLPLAISEFEAIRKDFPKESRVLAPLALAYRQAGRDEDAIKVYDTLLLADPRASWARDQKAVVLANLKRYDEARAMYESQIAQSPENRQLYANISYVFQSQGKPDAFLDWALPRLDKSPGNATLMAVVLDEFARQKREEQGWTILRGSAATHKGQRSVVESIAGLMVQRGKKEDAIALFRQLAAQYPNDMTAQLVLADQLFAAGQKDEAAKAYSTLIGRPNLGASEKLSLRRQLAQRYLEQGNTAEALNQLQEIVKADPNDFDSSAKLVIQLEAAGRYSEAIPVVLNLAAREIYNPQVRAQLRSRLGNLYLKKGDKVEATAQFRKALELNPMDTAAQTGLAQIAKG